MGPKLFLIQPGSSTRLGASSTARSVAKTDYSVVNWSNSHKFSCLKKWSPKKSKPMSARRVDSNRPLKNAASKSRNLKINAKPIQSTSRSKICLSKTDFSGCVQRKNTSSTPFFHYELKN